MAATRHRDDGLFARDDAFTALTFSRRVPSASLLLAALDLEGEADELDAATLDAADYAYRAEWRLAAANELRRLYLRRMAYEVQR